MKDWHLGPESKTCFLMGKNQRWAHDIMIPAVGKVNVNHSFHVYPCEVKFDWMRIRTKMASGFSFTGASHELTCRNLAPKGRFAKTVQHAGDQNQRV